ncbi:MAG: hypothetical protein IJ629_02485 [Clostridia bacterium]|nr:hypothetical protein [Clostridia bacterium]
MEELSAGKVTAKFAIKFILWTILFFIIGAIIVGVISGGAISKFEDDLSSMEDVEEMFSAINGFVYGLVIVDIIVALLATKLAIKGVAKKTKVTSDNRKKYLKGISIVLIVIAVLVLVFHTIIVKTLDKMIVEDTGTDSLKELIEEAEEDADKIGDAFEIAVGDEDEFEEAVKLLKGLNTAGTIYSVSGLIFVAMIPVANVFLKKKEVQE